MEVNDASHTLNDLCGHHITTLHERDADVSAQLGEQGREKQGATHVFYDTSVIAGMDCDSYLSSLDVSAQRGEQGQQKQSATHVFDDTSVVADMGWHSYLSSLVSRLV
jgi:hypothetical protein